jgi:hypothetical protein
MPAGCFAPVGRHWSPIRRLDALFRTISNSLQLSQLNLAELTNRTFGLNRDLTLVGGAFIAMIDQGSVDLDLNFIACAFNHHLIPFTQWFFGSISGVQNAPRFVAVYTPILLRAAPRDHVVDFNVLADAPEISSIVDVHLALNRLREHFVQTARRGCVHQNPAVAWFAGPAIFHYQTVVLVNGVGDQVALWVAIAKQNPVFHAKRRLNIGIVVRVGHVGVPTGKVGAIEKLSGRGAAGSAETEEDDRQEDSHDGSLAIFTTYKASLAWHTGFRRSNRRGIFLLVQK